MADQKIYTVGGTVQAGGGIYIPRKADDDLLTLCRAGELAFILSSRQVGKSSLMVRTARQLESEGVRSVMIDLSAIGVKVSQDEWYLGILNEIATTLNLEADIFLWWAQYAGLGPAQKLSNFFRDILLKEINERVVLFFDEIDSTLSIPFADDFFAALRAVYNARSTTPDFKRLSFVLVGVATPSDLIKDEKRTPFNIGYRVDLTDFTPKEALPLAGKLGEKTLGWVFDWTGGHPYLTQRLCAHLSKVNLQFDLQEESVADAVKQLFEGEQGKQDNNLQFVRDMLTKRAPDTQRVLKTYKDIRSGKKVSDDERSIPKAHLKISGVVRRENGNLKPRNRIYERTFDLAWVKENTPPATTRRLVALSSFITIIALVIAGYFYYQQQTQASDILAATYIDNFNNTNSQEVQITSLAALFGLGDKYALQARELFDALSPIYKLRLFDNLATPANVGNELAIVVGGVCQNVENTLEGNKLLRTMADVLGQTESTNALKLEPEITAWVDGREAAGEGEYPSAINSYTRAFKYSQDRKNENAAILVDRAVAYTILEKYDAALADYDNAVRIDTNRANEVQSAILGSQSLANYWLENSSSYPNLLSSISFQPPPIVSILPIIPTQAPTPTPLPAEIVDAKGVTMVLVPAGEFTMGSNNGDPDEQPVHQVYLDAFYMDRYEITNAHYKACVADGSACLPPKFDYSSTRPSYYDNIKYDNYPVIFVDWEMAMKYCEWRGMHLPAEAQWEKAARGTNDGTYPWGEGIGCDKANYANEQTGNACVGDTKEVGSYESDKSSYGIFDLAGNVREWVADWYSNTYYQNLIDVNPLGPSVPSNQLRVQRGGSWFSWQKDARSTDRFGYPYSDLYGTLGFRCARSP
ncbi:MAG: SUMF1/EgtB/PvdO family nonheme iron enzyme [Chloroflexota bacterium]